MFDYILQVIGELLVNAYHSTLQGYIGVSAIFGYMTFIIIVGVWRSLQAAKEDH
jgi:hypothetical protein